jgi:putative tRNA adenosine deaminase-associated protein
MALNRVCNHSFKGVTAQPNHADSGPKAVTVLAAEAGLRADGHRADLEPRRMLDGDVTVAEMTSGDFCIAVYREDNAWEAEVLPAAVIDSLESIIHALRQQPSIGGVIGLTAVGDDFFVITRVIGSHASVFLSDLTASVDWPLAKQVLEYLDIPVPYDEDLDQVLPAGDMSILADLGIDEMELCALAGDLDLFPDEVLTSLARRAGFGAAFDRALASVTGQ